MTTRLVVQRSVLLAALVLAGTASAQTTPVDGPTSSVVTLSPGQLRVADRVATPFAQFAGSNDNAVAIANALRTGTPTTLTYTTTEGGKTVTATTEFTPATQPMGWGNVSHSMALARYSLAQSGVTNPTGDQLVAALNGGELTINGKSIELAGVLQQRASGMGWGRIAQTYGTTMGAVNRTLRAGTTTVATATPGDRVTHQPKAAAAGTTLAPSPRGLTTAGGTSATTTQGKRVVTHGKPVTTAGANALSTGGPKGLVTASGTPAGSGPAASGLSTASSASSKGIVTAQGVRSHGNAYGRGIVTASTGSAGVTAASPSRGSSGAVTAAGHAPNGAAIGRTDGGNSSGNGRGKGGG